tara:strand:- start:1091 stop:1327 length:237 start_codon:yes stop_codon:yes gene_type:complete
MKIDKVSGKFDRFHPRHIDYFKAARKHRDKLIVALRSDEWHQLTNQNKEPSHIIEIQYFKYTGERDIERLRFLEDRHR